MFLTVLHSKRFIAATAMLIVVAAVIVWRQAKRGTFRSFLTQAKQRLHDGLWRVAWSRDFSLVIFVLCVGFLIGERYAVVASKISGPFFYISPGMGHLHSWKYGFLLGISVTLVYGILRAGMGRLVAVLSTLMFATSPIQFYFLQSSPWRDYPRGPYILAILFCLVWAVRAARTIPRACAISAATGLICGLGGYQREEIVTFVFPAALTLVFFTPYRVPQSIKLKLVGLFVLFFSFGAVVPRPILNFTSQNTVAGFVSHMDWRLGLSRPPYDLGYLFLDEFISATGALIEHPESGKTSLGQEFVRKYVRYFPADFLIRVYASVIRVLEFPFRSQLPPQGITSSLLRAFYGARASVQSLCAGLEIPLCLATFLTLATINFRLGIFYLFILFYLAGLFTVQFFGKAFFYMELFAWWNVGFLAQQTIWAILRMRTGNTSLPFFFWRQRSVRIWATLGATCILALVLPLILMRVYQTRTVTRLFRQLTGGASELFPRPKGIVVHDIVFFPRPFWKHAAGSTEYLKAEFSRENCPVDTVWPVLRYRVSNLGEHPTRRDWSRTVTIGGLDTSPTVSFFFPVWDGFVGIELPKEEAGCLRTIQRMKDPSQFPFQMTVAIPSVGATGILYQTLDDWELSRTRSSKSLFGRAPGNPAPGTPIAATDLDFHAPILHLERDRWRVRGYALPPIDPHWEPRRDRSRSILGQAWFEDVSVYEVDTDILRTKSRFLRKGSLVVIEGTLYTGGFTAGLVRGGRSAGSVSFVTPGPFRAILEAPSDGQYSAGLAHRLSSYSYLENRFDVRRAVWIETTTAPILYD